VYASTLPFRSCSTPNRLGECSPRPRCKHSPDLERPGTSRRSRVGWSPAASTSVPRPGQAVRLLV
jgi:hypothetical protein